MRTALLPTIAILSTFCANAQAAVVDPVNFSESVYVSSVDIGSITGIDWAPDGSGRLFVIRKGGFSGISLPKCELCRTAPCWPHRSRSRRFIPAANAG